MNEPVILFEDPCLVVCCKPAGWLSEDSDSPRSMPRWLREHYHTLGQNDHIDVVHRLDQVTGGIIVFSRRAATTGRLTAAVTQDRIAKEYLAVLTGHIEPAAGDLTDLLFRDARKNKSYVVKRMRKGVREARLSYQTVDTADSLSLVRVQLHTGRTHQIRVQFASRQLPLLGDTRYGSRDERCSAALWACRLVFPHPVSRKPVEICLPPPDQYPWNRFSAQLIPEAAR